MKTQTILLATALFAFQAFAADYDYPAGGPDGYVYLETSDPSGTSSFNSAGKWSDKTAPETGRKYYVGRTSKTDSLSLRTPSDSTVSTPTTHTFAGDELRVKGNINVLASKNEFVDIPNLVLVGSGVANSIGGHISFNANKPPVSGTVHVVGTTDAQAPYTMAYLHQTADLITYEGSIHAQENTFALEGDANQWFTFYASDSYAGLHPDPKTGETRPFTYSFVMQGDMSAYYGTILIRPYSRITLASPVLNAKTVRIQQNGVLTTRWRHGDIWCACGRNGWQLSDAKIARVYCHGGAELNPAPGGVMEITTQVELEGDCVFDFGEVDGLKVPFIAAKMLLYGGVASGNRQHLKATLSGGFDKPMRYDLMRVSNARWDLGTLSDHIISEFTWKGAHPGQVATLEEENDEDGNRIVYIAIRNSIDDGETVVVPADKTLTFGTLTFNGGTLDFTVGSDATNGLVRVADALTVTKPIVVHIGLPAKENVLLHHELMRIAASAIDEVKPEMFILDVPGVYGDLPHASLSVEQDAETDEWVVSVDAKEIVTLIRESSADIIDFSPLMCAKNANGEDYWSDGLAPQPGKDYYVNVSAPYTRTFNMPTNANASSTTVFRGDSLTLGENATLASGWKSQGNVGGVTIPELQMLGGLVNVWYGFKQPDLRDENGLRLTGGRLVTHAGYPASRLASFSTYLLYCDLALVGDGDVAITTHPTSLNAKGNVELGGDNSGFTGGIIVTSADFEKDGQRKPSEDIYAKLVVSNGRNLGGALESFRADALTVEQMSMVAVHGDTDLAANRGLTVNGLARFAIDEGMTFSTASALTLNGTLRVEGPGTLSLGGELIAGTDPVIDVRAGALEPRHPNALKGAALRFGDEINFVFDVNPSDEMKASGVHGVALPATGTINVSFDTRTLPVFPEGSTIDLRLFTVDTEPEAAALASRIVCAKPYDGISAQVGVAPNGDGTYSVVANISKRGFLLILR